MQLPLSDLAHGGEDILVVTIAEPEATGPDFVLVEAGAGQCFHAVRFGDFPELLSRLEIVQPS